jgi:hypothetical protein
MIERTREVRTAHEEYHSFLHDAQDEGAINDVDQWQNFKDHASDGYSDESLRLQGFPMSEKKEERVDKWVEDVSENLRLHAAGLATVDAPEQRFADQANWRPTGEEVSVDSGEQQWVGHVSSLGFGEDVEVMEDRSGFRRLIDKRIAQTNQIRSLQRCELVPEECIGQKMLKRPFENAENDFYPSDRAPEKNVETSPSQQLAEEATGDPNGVDDLGGQVSNWTFPKWKDILWKDNAVDGYDGENFDGIE